LFGTFGALALGLAAVGLYGVKAYSVARRTREIGIRMALGARRSAVQNMILREGAAMLAAGLVLGLLLALATGRILSSILYGVGALDPIAFTIAPIVLAAAGLLATWLPARRATRISPMAALRTE
jgi:ABC-type antimicrobial peptide transport system permease subunit